MVSNQLLHLLQVQSVDARVLISLNLLDQLEFLFVELVAHYRLDATQLTLPQIDTVEPLSLRQKRPYAELGDVFLSQQLIQVCFLFEI